MPNNKIAVMLAMVAAVLACAVAAQAALPEVVAVVNGEKITAKQLNTNIADWSVPLVLNEMIMHKLVEQQARKAGVVIKPEQVTAALNQIKNRLPEGETLEHALFVGGMARSRLVANITTGLRAEAIVRKSIKIKDQELSRYYKMSRLGVQIGLPASEDAAKREKDEAEAKQKIDSIAKEIAEGMSFADAARKYSEENSSKTSGGDSFWVALDGLPSELSKAVSELKVGQVSAPIKMPYGYYLVKLDATGAGATAAEKKELVDTIVSRQMADGTLVQNWLAQIRSEGKVQNALEPKVPKPAATAPKPAPKPAAAVPAKP